MEGKGVQGQLEFDSKNFALEINNDERSTKRCTCYDKGSVEWGRPAEPEEK